MQLTQVFCLIDNPIFRMTEGQGVILIGQLSLCTGQLHSLHDMDSTFTLIHCEAYLSMHSKMGTAKTNKSALHVLIHTIQIKCVISNCASNYPVTIQERG